MRLCTFCLYPTDCNNSPVNSVHIASYQPAASAFNWQDRQACYGGCFSWHHRPRTGVCLEQHIAVCCHGLLTWAWSFHGVTIAFCLWRHAQAHQQQLTSCVGASIKVPACAGHAVREWCWLQSVPSQCREQVARDVAALRPCCWNSSSQRGDAACLRPPDMGLPAGCPAGAARPLLQLLAACNHGLHTGFRSAACPPASMLLSLQSRIGLICPGTSFRMQSSQCLLSVTSHT